MPEVWRSKITDDKLPDGGCEVRGVRLEELMKSGTFTDALLLTIFGDTLSDGQKRVIEAFLAGMVDHGIGVASVRSGRLVASTGADMASSLAAGILAAGGSRHGGAVGKATAYFEQLDTSSSKPEEVVEKAIKEKERIPGFGHKTLKDGDPRAIVLGDIAQKEGVAGDALAFAREMEKEFEKQKGKKLPLNVDGTFGALLVDMGIPPSRAEVFFLLARTPGILAHVIEENEREGGIRRLEHDEYSFE